MSNVPTGNYQPTLGIDAVITSIKSQLKIEDSSSDIWFTKMVNEGVRALDILTLFKRKIEVLEVRNNIACLPCGFLRMLALRFGAPPYCGTAIYVDIPFANYCGCNNIESGGDWGGIFAFSNSYQIQGSNIVFNQAQNFSVNGDFIPQPITNCTIAYFGFDVDAEGLFNVYADMERALTAYVCWKYAMQNFREYPTAIRAEYRQEFSAQKKWLKGNAVYTDFMNTRWQVAEWSNAILVNKFWQP